jgi:signal transduction histidine kinase
VDDIRISCTVDPEIAVLGEARRLRQVFWNLLINSCQAMPQGGKMTISASPVQYDDDDDDSAWCEIVIADTGQGISPEHLAKIFDPFFTTKIGGTGLGLAIVYRIIEDHGGTIAVEAEEGKGTKFRILIPMIEGPSQPEILGSRIRHRVVS